MAAITSTGSGDWNSTTPNAPWPSGIVPVSGDTVTIANGHTVTVPVGYTAVVGSSPSDDTGTPAIQCASSTGTGILIVNGTLQYKGPIRQANATWTVGPGGTLTYDASGAGTPATALYKWQISQASNQANAKLVFNGSSGSHCTFNSVGNVAAGTIGSPGTNYADGGRVEATYTDFSYLGTSSVSAIMFRYTTSAGRLILDHCTFDNCGMIEDRGAISADCTYQITNTKITNPLNSTYTIYIGGTTVRTTGVRRLENYDITGRIYCLGTSGAATGFTIKNGINRQVYTLGNPLLEWTGGASVASWDQNLLVHNSGTGQDQYARVPSGTLTNTYVYRQANPAHSNCHPIYFNTVGGSMTIQGWIGHYTGTDINSDWFEFSGADAVSARTLTINNNIFLPGATGKVLGSLYNNSSGFVQSNTVVTFNHNTIIGGGESGSNAFGVGAEAVAHCLGAGSIASISSNIKYSDASATGWIAQTPSFGGNPAADANAITSADYNATYNISTSIYAGNPSGQFAGTPGTHDITADPQFVASSRSILNFDQGYLGAAVGTAWANSTSYSVGDVVSASTSTFFNSATYNFRCISAHTSATATDKPGSGTAWAAKWEPACLKTISDDVLAGNTYSGGTNSLIGELVAWVKAGFAPTNAAIRNAGHDGVTIGAVEFAGGLSIPILSNHHYRQLAGV